GGNNAGERIKKFLSGSTPRGPAALKPASIGVSEQDAEDLAQILRELPENEALTMLEDVTARLLSEIFRTAPDRLDRNRSLQEMGMHSLMAVELQGVLERQFDCDIPVMEVVTTGGDPGSGAPGRHATRPDGRVRGHRRRRGQSGRSDGMSGGSKEQDR